MSKEEKRTPLKEWVKANSQAELARRTGITQGGIRKMYLSGRHIVVIESGATTKLEETKMLTT